MIAMLNPWRDEPGPLHDARCAVHDTDLPCSCAADDERLDPRNAYQGCTEAVEGHPSKRYHAPECCTAENRRKEQRHAAPAVAPALPVVAVERKPWRPEGWPAEPRWAS